jgi:TolB-like protein
LGEQNLKNIARPVRAFAVVRDGLSRATKAGSTTPSPLSVPHLSMVVLPFVNIGCDPQQDYFADGVTESLTTDLSRIRGPAALSLFSAHGQIADARKIDVL